MEKETLQYLAEYVANISPELWEVTLQYIHAAAMQWLVGSVAVVLVATILFILTRKYAEDDDIKAFSYIIQCVLVASSFCCIAAAVGRFISPEMYAIKYLLAFMV